MIGRKIRSLGLWLTTGIITLVALGCSNPEQDIDEGVHKPIDRPNLATTRTTLTEAPSTTTQTPVPLSVPMPSEKRPTAVVEPTPTPRPTPRATPTPTPAPEIPPDVKAVFDEMDQRFAGSDSRSVQITARIVMMSSLRGYRSNTGINIRAEYPNLFNLLGSVKTETNDPETTTTWNKGGVEWGVISDGKQMLLTKGPLIIAQETPPSLDELLDQRIEIEGWGSSPLINCFLKRKPSVAFLRSLRRARIVERTDEEIRLELVTEPPAFLIQKSGLPRGFDVVLSLTIDAKTYLPTRCYVDLIPISQFIYQQRESRTVPLQEAFMEIRVVDADLAAEFKDKNLFKIPEDLLKKATVLGPKPDSPTPPPGSPQVTPAL